MDKDDINLWIWGHLLIFACSFKTVHGDSICVYGHSISLNHNPHIAACPGRWSGHINTANAICAPGWRVCSWEDRAPLGTVTWDDARALDGCYAFNAAHDGGTCRPCLPAADQDNLAGVGHMCPHQNLADTSCLGEGRVDASCCSDSAYNLSCTYKPYMSGVLCCRLPGQAPRILVRPEPLTHVISGVTFVLSCQARGEPQPTVTWLKNGQPLANNASRVRVFDSGYLLISQAQPHDSGNYQCIVSNFVGIAVTDAKILVTEHESGCADGSSDGLAQYENIHACKGSWSGHVKRGRPLCAKGWQVCNPRHIDYIKQLSVADVTQTEGCYAYNAMNVEEGCERCHREHMAGIGLGCGRWRHSHRSCLAQGRMDVLKGNLENKCAYEHGLTTGVLCCKRPKQSNRIHVPGPVISCTPQCEHGGTCTGYNKCVCRHGYKGAWCQHPICAGGCIPNSYCMRPSLCRCKSGYTFNGDKCTRRYALCRHACFNGGVCKHGHCKCPQFYHGKMCQYGGGTSAIRIDHDTGQVHLQDGTSFAIDSNQLDSLPHSYYRNLRKHAHIKEDTSS